MPTKDTEKTISQPIEKFDCFPSSVVTDRTNLSLQGFYQRIPNEVNISHGYKIHNQNIKFRPDTVTSQIYVPEKTLN